MCKDIGQKKLIWGALMSFVFEVVRSCLNHWTTLSATVTLEPINYSGATPGEQRRDGPER